MKKLLSLIIIFIISAGIFAACDNGQKNRLFKSIDESKISESQIPADAQKDFLAVLQVSDGYLSVGYLKGAASTKAIVIKYDNKDNVIWGKTFGPELDRFNSAIEISEGYVVGNNTTILKLDKQGNLVWAKTVVSKYTSFKNIISNDSGFLIIDGTQSDDRFYSVPYNAVLAFQIDTNGDIVWEKVLNFNLLHNDWIDVAGVYKKDDKYFLLLRANIANSSGFYHYMAFMDKNGIIQWQKNINMVFISEITIEEDGILVRGIESYNSSLPVVNEKKFDFEMKLISKN